MHLLAGKRIVLCLREGIDFELQLGKIALANGWEGVPTSHKGMMFFCGHWITVSDDSDLFSFFGLPQLTLCEKRDSFKISRDLVVVAEWTSDLLV